jgi:hypothetical protein
MHRVYSVPVGYIVFGAITAILTGNLHGNSGIKGLAIFGGAIALWWLIILAMLIDAFTGNEQLSHFLEALHIHVPNV